MKAIISFFTIIYSSNLFSQVLPPYETLDPLRKARCREVPGKNFQLEEMPTTVDQGKLGFCYACSAKSLMERHHLISLPPEERKEASKINFSTLEIVEKANVGNLKEGGHVSDTLVNVANNGYTLTVDEGNEEYRLFDNAITKLIKINEDAGTRQFIDGFMGPLNERLMAFENDTGKKFSNYKKTYQPEEQKAIIRTHLCPWLNHVKDHITNEAVDDLVVNVVKILEMQLKSDQFKKEILNLGFFKSQKIVDNKIVRMHPYSTYYFQSKDKEELGNKVEELIRSKIYTSFSFCTQWDKDLNLCSSGHATNIEGVKTLTCPKLDGSPGEETVRLFKVKNSYGEKWQKVMDDGWVLANNLLHNATLRKGGKNRILNWIYPCNPPNCHKEAKEMQHPLWVMAFKQGMPERMVEFLEQDPRGFQEEKFFEVFNPIFQNAYDHRKEEILSPSLVKFLLSKKVSPHHEIIPGQSLRNYLLQNERFLDLEEILKNISDPEERKKEALNQIEKIFASNSLGKVSDRVKVYMKTLVSQYVPEGYDLSLIQPKGNPSGIDLFSWAWIQYPMDPELIINLLKRGKFLEKQDSYFGTQGLSIFIQAANHNQIEEKNRAEIIQILKEKKVDINGIMPGNKMSPLMMAVKNADKKLMAHLMDWGADPFLKDQKGKKAKDYLDQIKKDPDYKNIKELIKNYEKKFKARGKNPK